MGSDSLEEERARSQTVDPPIPVTIAEYWSEESETFLDNTDTLY